MFADSRSSLKDSLRSWWIIQAVCGAVLFLTGVLSRTWVLAGAAGFMLIHAVFILSRRKGREE